MNVCKTIRRGRLSLIVLLFVTASSDLFAADDSRVHKDLEFATVDGHSLKLDLYVPAASDPPLLIWIHGGGWRAGSKEKCEVIWLTEHGYSVASISYRLTDKAIFPAQIHDCKAAVRWLRANAKKYGYSTNRIAVAGSSAGGHLAALLGTTGDVKDLEGTVGGNLEYSSRVDAIVDYYGATDFIQRTKTQPHKTNKEGSIVRLLLGGPADQRVELARLASSAFHVTNDDPPLLIFHGGKDNKVLIGQSERIVDVYTRAKLPVTLYVLENSGHGGKEFYSGRQRELLVEFLNKHLCADSSLPRSSPESQGVLSAQVRAFVEAADQNVDTMHSFITIGVEAAESEARTPAVTRLERLKPSGLLLRPPEGLRGGFVAARGAPDVDFAVFPGQFSGARLWSSWGDVLAASDGRFYAAIGDHHAPHGTTFVYCVDPKEKTVTRVIDCNRIVPTPPDKYSPGKIHAPLVQADDGGIYVFGYRGSVRQTGSEIGYCGDWLLRYRPATGHTENLGMPVPFSSVPVLEHCSAIGCLYGLSVPGQTMPEPQTQLFRYDLRTGRVTFTCQVDAKGPRAIIVARDGRVYFGGGDSSGGEQRLMRYDPRSNRVTKLRIRIPGDGMLRAASRADADGVVYGISKDGVVFAFDTNTETVTEIAKAFVAGRLYTAVCRLDPTDTYLYYIPGAHGRSSETGTPVIQLNVRTRRCKVLAFLNETLRQQKNYNLGGTYGIALSRDGSQLFISFNGAELPAGRQSEFGLCSAMLLDIPESERNGR